MDETDHPRDEVPPERTAFSPRRVLLAVLCASGAFLLFVLLADFWPVLIYLGCVVFLLVGLWVGRRSDRPWVDGALYGGLSTLVAAVLLALVSELGWFGWLAALFLALPQGVVGVWVGARLLRRRG